MGAAASTDFRDSPQGLFTVPAECYMHRQASFIPSFFPEGTD
jgi:alpha-glucoside transport system substrate-binding protein